MQNLLFASCLMFLLSLVMAAPVDAKGGKGNGGGRGRASSGGGQGGGGGAKWGGQRSGQGGGNEQANHGGRPTDGNDLLVEKKDHPVKDREKKERASRSASNNETDENEADNRTAPNNRKQKQLGIEQRNLEKRIAQAQHLREIAARNGNQNLLANADRMEAEAINHYAQRVEHLEKFGVTDPALDSDGITYPSPTPPSPTPAPTPTPATVVDPTVLSGGTTTPLSAGPQQRSVLVKPARSRP